VSRGIVKEIPDYQVGDSLLQHIEITHPSNNPARFIAMFVVMVSGDLQADIVRVKLDKFLTCRGKVIGIFEARQAGNIQCTAGIELDQRPHLADDIVLGLFLQPDNLLVTAYLTPSS
jgi:hypothetical protein